MSDQRWSAVVSDLVTEHILAYRHDELVLRRFYEKVDYGFSKDDCHIWTGALSSEGYGDFRLPGKTVRAHRAQYIWSHGEAPPQDAPFLDHSTICVGRFCLNLLHLEPVDNAENTRRGRGIGKTAQRSFRQVELALRDERRARGDMEFEF